MLLLIEKVLWTIIIVIAFIFCLVFDASKTFEEIYQLFCEDLTDTWME